MNGTDRATMLCAIVVCSLRIKPNVQTRNNACHLMDTLSPIDRRRTQSFFNIVFYVRMDRRNAIELHFSFPFVVQLICCYFSKCNEAIRLNQNCTEKNIYEISSEFFSFFFSFAAFVSCAATDDCVLCVRESKNT